jgi:hypothetical protein
MSVITECVYPPIPTRDYDWCAYLEGDEENGPYGRGPTERDALINLAEMLSLELDYAYTKSAKETA